MDKEDRTEIKLNEFDEMDRVFEKNFEDLDEFTSDPVDDQMTQVWNEDYEEYKRVVVGKRDTVDLTLDDDEPPVEKKSRVDLTKDDEEEELLTCSETMTRLGVNFVVPPPVETKFMLKFMLVPKVIKDVDDNIWSWKRKEKKWVLK